jgi:hypothetical protein
MVVSGAGHRMAQPTLPEQGCTRHLQRVDASHPRPKQDHEGFGYRGCGNARLGSVMEPGCQQSGKLERLISLYDQAPQQVRVSSARAVSILLRTLPK